MTTMACLRRRRHARMGPVFHAFRARLPQDDAVRRGLLLLALLTGCGPAAGAAPAPPVAPPAPVKADPPAPPALPEAQRVAGREWLDPTGTAIVGFGILRVVPPAGARSA